MKTKHLVINSWRIMIVLILFIISGAKAQNCNNNRLIFDQNFNQYNGQNKQYTRSLANNDFPRIAGRTSGGNVRGLSNHFPQRNRVINGELRAEYTKNDASGRSGGFVFDNSFNGVEEATLEYRVKFANDFVWATGGKLPGLGGASTSNGAQPAGCTQNQNTIKNAFSARLMWRSNRTHTQAPYLILYDYLPNRQTRCGGNTRLGNLTLQKNKWYTIKQYIKLNTPGRRNGILKMYVNGQKLLDQDDVLFRLSGKGSVKINSIVMHTYRGGNRTDPVWHSPQNDYAYFDDFKVWTNCSGSGGGGNQSPTVSITSPLGNTTVQEGYTSFEVTANAADSDGSVSNVKLYVDETLVRQENVAPYTWGNGDNIGELLGLSVGNHIIKIEATDNDGAKAETTFTLKVGGKTTNPVVSFISPSGNLTVQEGYDIEVEANATDDDGTINNIKLYINKTLVRQESIAPYTWGHVGSPNPQEVNGLSEGIYTFRAVATDNDGNTSESTFTLTVKSNDGGGNDENCSFGTPIANGISAMNNVSYTYAHVLGQGGPSLDNLRRFSINWNPTYNGLYKFAIITKNGVPNWYVNFSETMNYQLKDAQPEVTLVNTGFDGLDGSYWVSQDGDNLVLVSKNQDFKLYFSNATQAPQCAPPVSKDDFQDIVLYPNPIKNDVLSIKGLKNQGVSIQVFSLIGSRVLSKTAKGMNTYNLPVGTLKTGNYILKITSNGINKSLYFTKQ
ncbi:polysaccharide lyase [Aquimarina sp. 2201CG1-2-11]|uniref:polysaccharide lyase n=1 Tax=Aquimarina discodermiae TaxID=3231043 RepID=UPI0034622EF7